MFFVFTNKTKFSLDKMKFILFLLINILYVRSIVQLPKRTSSYANNKKIILTKIASNYLDKYFDHEQVYFSIMSSSSNIDQKYFQTDLIVNLVKSSKLSNYSHSFLNQMDQLEDKRETKNVFNLIFVDDRNALMYV